MVYPNINPVAFEIGPLSVHWYGLMYLFGFAAVWALCIIPWRRERAGLSSTDVADMIFYGALGAIIGGRVGYILFYNFSHFMSDPSVLVKVWQGGMSFHGGLIGVVIALWLFAKLHKQSFFAVTDLIAPAVPIGLGLGRIGNFINAELWGRVTDMPWGFIYPHVDQFARHPSALYQAFLEGLVLFIILWIYAFKPRPRMFVTAWFVILYSVFRLLSELFREPDAHLGFIAFGWLTMGQLLSLFMLAVGMYLLAVGHKKAKL